jgi:hypothetical protein
MSNVPCSADCCRVFVGLHSTFTQSRLASGDFTSGLPKNTEIFHCWMYRAEAGTSLCDIHCENVFESLSARFLRESTNKTRTLQMRSNKVCINGGNCGCCRQWVHFERSGLSPTLADRILSPLSAPGVSKTSGGRSCHSFFYLSRLLFVSSFRVRSLFMSENEYVMLSHVTREKIV